MSVSARHSDSVFAATYAISMSSSMREMISPCSATMVAIRVYMPVIYVVAVRQWSAQLVYLQYYHTNPRGARAAYLHDGALHLRRIIIPRLGVFARTILLLLHPRATSRRCGALLHKWTCCEVSAATKSWSRSWWTQRWRGTFNPNNQKHNTQALDSCKHNSVNPMQPPASLQ